MTAVDEVEVVVAHQDCATLRVGEVFLKIDGDQTRSSVEVDGDEDGSHPDSRSPVAR